MRILGSIFAAFVGCVSLCIYELTHSFYPDSDAIDAIVFSMVFAFLAWLLALLPFSVYAPPTAGWWSWPACAVYGVTGTAFVLCVFGFLIDRSDMIHHFGRAFFYILASGSSFSVPACLCASLSARFTPVPNNALQRTGIGGRVGSEFKP